MNLKLVVFCNGRLQCNCDPYGYCLINMSHNGIRGMPRASALGTIGADAPIYPRQSVARLKPRHYINSRSFASLRMTEKRLRMTRGEGLATGPQKIYCHCEGLSPEAISVKWGKGEIATLRSQ